MNRRQLASLEDLLAGARAGAPGPTRAFVTAIGPTVLAATRRVVGARHPDVEDIAQEAVMAVLKALATFRAECSIRHFVCRIATHTALSARRHARYREVWTPATEPQSLDALSNTNGLAADDAAVLERKRLAVRRLLDELPEAQAEAAALYFIMGFTAEEIADTTETSVNTVRSRIRLARTSLKARIEGSDILNQMLREAQS